MIKFDTIQVSPFKSRGLKDIKNPEATLKKAVAQLDCQWWISSGTAIGLYRDGDFIPNDSDLDIGVKARFGQRHITLQGLRLIRMVNWEGRPIQTAYIDDANDCIFDIYYYYCDIAKGKLITISPYGHLHFQRPFIIKPEFEIEQFNTKYGVFPFLSPIEDYLEDRFGKNWRTPSNSKCKYDRMVFRNNRWELKN